MKTGSLADLVNSSLVVALVTSDSLLRLNARASRFSIGRFAAATTYQKAENNAKAIKRMRSSR